MTTPEKQPICDLFCGPGGMSTGFSHYFDITYAIDKSRPAVQTYQANHAETQVQQRDVRNLSGVHGDFTGMTGVIGGPPCQGFSAMSTKSKSERNADPRNLLGLEFMRLVEEIHPTFFVLENVPSADGGRKNQIINLGKRLGYNVTSDRLNAAEFGSAQSRHRWIVIGLKTGTWSPAACPRPSQPRTIRMALKIYDRNPTKNWGYMRSRPDTLEKLAQATTEWTSLSGDPDKYENRIKLQWDQPAPAITNVKKVYFVHPSEVRNITLAEAAALQGFPPDYIWKGGERQIGQLMADAMPVELAQSIACSLRGVA